MSNEVQPVDGQTVVPDDLRGLAAKAGWPDDLLQRALEAGISRCSLDRWLGWRTDAEEARRRIDWHERLTFGSLRGREATQADNEALSDLWANAPEELGDWEIITERTPNAFAQFRLQENVNVLVIEEQGRLIASCAFSTRNVLVGGARLTVRYGQALRVRKESRRQGYGDQVRSLAWGVGAARPSHAQYDYMRSQNFAVVNWWKKYDPDFFDDVPDRAGDVPGISVTVLQYPARPFDGDRTGIRPATPADLSRCVGLINRTHRGQDLFRPYTAEFLRERLDDGTWGERPPGWTWLTVYGWSDFHVLEEQGRVVACAGLWDRGRDMRDKVRSTKTGEEKTISVSALLDFGYAAGHEASMARLIACLIGETSRLRRDYLTVPLDQLPEVARLLEEREPAPETRALRWGLQEPAVTRPYTDLAYW